MASTESARKAVWLIVILAIIVAVTFKLTRRDLTITRAAALATPLPTLYRPTGLLPHLDGILTYLGNFAFEDSGPRWGAAAQPSPVLASMLKFGADSKDSGALIPSKRKLWHL